MTELMICFVCGEETHDDTSALFDVFTLTGVTQERHCFDCDPPDSEE